MSGSTNEVTTFHEGKPIIQQHGDRIVVLCPYGHVHTSMRLADWAHSHLEAKASNPDWTVRCGGGIHPRTTQEVL